MLDTVLAQLDRNADDAVARLMEFLSIPSVSTDPAYRTDVARAATWTAEHLRRIGLTTRIIPTAGHPVVLGHSDAGDVLNPGGPRILFYGHYDVQPPDPVEKWQTPPFEPNIRDGAIHARGASDDKGQVCTFLEALLAWKQAHGKLPLPVTVLIEGEEECGSANLPAFVEQHKAELAADFVLISDTVMWNAETVAITYGLRGLIYFDVQLHNANRDLHSGMYGGILANPATILTRVLGRLFDDKHRVTIPGFYDDVVALGDDEKQRWAKLGFDERRDLFDPIGVETPFGEAGYSSLERRWARPACDVNGLYGGYGGQGAKTVIPSFAGAKVSFRIAPQQKPDAISDGFEAWLRKQDVSGCRWRITRYGHSEAVLLPTESRWIAAASRAVQRTTGREPALIREGATLPVVADFKQKLGLDSLLLGFAMPNDRVHAPNEKFELRCLHLGARTHAALLAELLQG